MSAASSGESSTRVVVVGSLNLDIVVTLERVPLRGETVFGTGYRETPGGKGANQAIAAARRVSTQLIGALGNDDAGETMARYLDDRGVGLAHVEHHPLATGRAYITVTPDGENSITVLPLANSLVTADTVTAALDREQPTVVATQRESPDEAVEAAAAWCRRTGARFILNASPTAPTSDELLATADPLIVNYEEAVAILGLSSADGTSLANVAARLVALAPSAVVTAGSDGAYVADGSGVTRVPATRVTPVDTTGAGDEFAGTLAAELAQGTPLLEAAIQAGQASAALIQRGRDSR